MKATSPVKRITSPISFASPTETVSYIFASDIPSALTAGPLTQTILPFAAILASYSEFGSDVFPN